MHLEATCSYSTHYAVKVLFIILNSSKRIHFDLNTYVTDEYCQGSVDFVQNLKSWTMNIACIDKYIMLNYASTMSRYIVIVIANLSMRAMFIVQEALVMSDVQVFDTFVQYQVNVAD